MRRLKIILASLLLATLATPPAEAQRKRPGKPLTTDFDTKDIPEPQPRTRNDYYDFFDNSIFEQVQQTFDLPRHFHAKPAANVNARDAVPDSSWFTNRNGAAAMPLEETRRGPNRSAGPDPAGPWTIVSAKGVGATPGFQIKTANGERYLIKLDPAGYEKTLSSAEIIVTKLYYAAGYNTPENFLVRFRPEMLEISPQATMVDTRGVERPFAKADLDALLAQLARRADGSYQALASRFLDGKPKGPFAYAGLRSDDPNDWIPHEHRRELRGLRVIAAWLNDNDVREGNTLDMYVAENGRHFLRHYLLDFNSALGAESTRTDAAYGGYEHTLDWSSVAGSLFTLGLHQPGWTARQTPSYPGVGALDADRFEPQHWKQNSPLVAFENMTLADGYWAAKIVMSFSDEQIRAVIAEGRFDDPGAAEFLARALSTRRDKTGRHWFRAAGALDDFRIQETPSGPAVVFDDLAVAHHFAEPAERTYRYRVRSPRSGAWQQTEGALPQIPLAAMAASAAVIELQVQNAGESNWSPAVAVFVARENGDYRIVGWTRAER